MSGKVSIHLTLGQRFGCLTVTNTKRSKIEGARNYTIEATCDCGTIKQIVPSELHRYRSCGCGIQAIGNLNSNWTGHGEISGNIWSGYRKGAAKRGLSFNITIEEAWNLFISQERKCALSGVLLTMGKGAYSSKCYEPPTASLDRIDSTKGYEVDNVQWIHKNINPMKMAMDETAFKEWCCLIADKAREDRTF